MMAPGAVDAVDVAKAGRNGAPDRGERPIQPNFHPGCRRCDYRFGERLWTIRDDDTLTYEAISSDPDRLAITRSSSIVDADSGLTGPSSGGSCARSTLTV